MRRRASHGGDGPLRIPAGRGLTGKVLETGRPERIDDYLSATDITTEFLGAAIREGAQSGLCVPMRDGDGKIIGVLALWRLRPSVYSDDDEALLGSLASLAAMGLGNARLYQQQQQRVCAELELHRRELERRLQVSDEALEVHHRLTRIAAEGNDLTALARAVQGFVGGPVVIIPERDRPPVLWPPAGVADLPRERDARPVREAVGSGSARPAAAGTWVSVGIEAANVHHGRLYARLPDPRPRDVITLEQSATICALLLGHEDLLQAAISRLRSEFVWELLDSARPAELAAAVLRRSPFPSLTIEAGISRAALDAQSLPQALHEARVALSAITPTTAPVVLFDDLGVLQFLIAPSGPADLHRYAEGVLGPLVEYDRRHGSDLVATLDRYFEHGCNASKTARDLQLHAKSLAYRLRRIAEIADLDLENRRTRLDVELALRILGPAGSA